jgi:hypothetical protein
MTKLLSVILTGLLAVAVPATASALCLVDQDCSDGNVCTGTEHCVNGSCTAGTALNCNDNNPCTIDGCDALVGCQHATVVAGSSCSDGNVCNGAETCQGTVCTPGTPAANGIACDDGNACTTNETCHNGACNGGSNRPNGTQCSDGNPCNGLEVCSSGTCLPGQPKVNGTPCGDGNPCNGDETCQNAVCVGGSPLPNGALCSDGFPCNGTETCLNQVCIAGVPPGNGSSCSDGNVCDGAETCQAQVCTQGPGLDCDDGNPCTTDTCDPVTGCHHSSLPNSTSCSDGAVCNGAETCQGGTCTSGAPPADGTPCPDGNSCNGNETCSGGQCAPGVFLPNGTSCSDSNVCNGAETCLAGQCTAGSALNCNDQNPCTIDSCNPVTACAHTPRPDGSSCDDEDVCNGVATCQSAVCQGAAPLFCDDADPTTVNGCDPLAGCTVDHTIGGTLLNVRKSGLVRWGIKAKTSDVFIFGGAILGNGTSADPVLNGATLRVVSTTAASPFDGRYDLPAGNWSYVGAPGENAGYRYKDRTPGAQIRTVQVKSNKPWKIAGRGADIGPHLDADPNPVAVHLTLGNQRYCMSFGGEAQFILFKRFRAKNAPAPASCTP